MALERVTAALALALAAAALGNPGLSGSHRDLALYVCGSSALSFGVSAMSFFSEASAAALTVLDAINITPAVVLSILEARLCGSHGWLVAPFHTRFRCDFAAFCSVWASLALVVMLVDGLIYGRARRRHECTHIKLRVQEALRHAGAGVGLVRKKDPFDV